MGRAPCCPKVGVYRGPWTAREDALLIDYIKAHGEGQWKSLPEKAGLLRCGKSCRLRWMNHLRPEIKRGNITPEEDDLIIRLHALLGNRWSLIAGRLPGRTDNEIKNYWNTHLSKRLPNNQNVLLSSSSSLKRKKKKKNNNNNNNNNNKRDSNRTSNKQQYKKNSSASSEISKLKVYLPKAVRVGSTFLSLYLTRNEDKGGGSMTSSQSLRVSGKSDEVLPCESSSVFELQENRGEIEIDHRRYDIYEAKDATINANHSCLLSDLEMPRMATNGANNISDDDSTLDEVYEEYLHLLGATDHRHHTELDDPLLHSGDFLVRSSSPVL